MSRKKCLCQDFMRDWTRLMQESTCLYFESLLVMGIRTTDLITGQSTIQENTLMVSEKIDAVADLGLRMAANPELNPAEAAHKAVTYYRRKVSANRRRLVKSRRKA